MKLTPRMMLAAALVLGMPALAMPGGGTSQPTQQPQNWPSSQAKKKPQDYKDAVALIGQGKCADALPLLEKAAQQSPKDADIHNQIGFCQRTLGKAAAESGDSSTASAKYTESFNAYRQALTLDPNHRGAREYVGELYLLLDRPADAEVQLEALKKLCPRGCPERDTLQKAVDDYKAKHPTPAQ